MSESLRSGSSKRGATSFLESEAKQGRLEIAQYQSQRSEMVSPAVDFHNNSVPTIYSWDSRFLTDSYFQPSYESPFYPINELRHVGYPNLNPQWDLGPWTGGTSNTDPFYSGAANVNHDSIKPSDLPLMNSVDINFWTPPFQLWLEGSKLADFLAIRKTQGNWSCQCQRVTWLTRSQSSRT